MRIKNALGILNTVITVKTVWWDKLSEEEKTKYLNTAKSFINRNAAAAKEKTQEYAAKAKEKKNNHNSTPSPSPAPKPTPPAS